MTSSDLRRTFLGFFEQHGHRVVASSPLVPGDDATLLFTNAGMNQFKDVFLGRDKRDYRRAASSQKCMRVSGKHNDLENVGPSLRHHTFFEMLGNFSFGDYFKEEAIGLAWTLLTDVWKVPADRLFATVFAGEGGVPRDDEAYAYWLRVLPASRIAELGAADNFWSMGETGPCGRCSEIHYYRGDHLPCPEPACRGVECSCDRYVEVWNNVFMEFDRQPDKRLVPLPAPSIDTGMGLERITAIMQGTLSNYDTDLFQPLLTAISQLSGRPYGGTMEPSDVSTRVIADHARAMTFLIADGVIPSNEHRGYTLRMIMRRAMRHGNRLGLTEPFLCTLVDVLVAQMGDPYPELRSGHEYVSKVVASEEERFEAVLTTGLPRLEELLDGSAAAGVLRGDDVFRLYDSYGLPKEFIEDTASQRGIAIDREGFEQAMNAQKVRARASSAFDKTHQAEFFAPNDATRQAFEQAGDQFEGYTSIRVGDVPVLALFDGSGQDVPSLAAGVVGLRGARSDAVLCRVRRPGVGCGAPVLQGRHLRRDRSERLKGRRLAEAAPHSCRAGIGDSRGPGDGRGPRRRARRHPPQSHGHAPAARSPPPGARHAREAEGLAGVAGSPPVRLRAHGAADRRRDRRDRTPRDCRGLPQHACPHRGPADAGSGGGRRHGPVRGEVRRYRARRLDSRLQHGTVRRDALRRHGRHRPVCHHPGRRHRVERAAHRGAHRPRRAAPYPEPARLADRGVVEAQCRRRPSRRRHRSPAGRGETPGPGDRPRENEGGSRRGRGGRG